MHPVHDGPWSRGRPSAAGPWRDLRAVTAGARPDRDLSALGLREAWDAGDRAPSTGWGRRPWDVVGAGRGPPASAGGAVQRGDQLAA